ncbi:MAG: hypothetical protein AAF607_03410 [Pseudomonadota bacterium]
MTRQLPWTVKGKRPQINEDSVDRLFSMVMALTSEVAVLRHRLDSMQKLAQNHGWLDREALENYLPDSEERREREAWREAFISRVLYVFEEELANLEGGESTERYWSKIADVESGDA